MFVDQALNNLLGSVRRTTVKNQDHVLIGPQRLIEQACETRLDVQRFVVNRDDRRQHGPDGCIHGSWGTLNGFHLFAG